MLTERFSVLNPLLPLSTLLVLTLLAFDTVNAATSAANAQEEQKAIAGYSARVFHTRVEHVMEYRLSAVRQCLKRNPLPALVALEKEIRTELKKAPARSAEESIRLLTLYHRTLTFDRPEVCARNFDLAGRDLESRERRKFSVIKGVLNGANLALKITTPLVTTGDHLAKIVSELDPYCRLRNERDLSGYNEKNPCFAGDRLVISAIDSGQDFRVTKSSMEMDQIREAFLTLFYQAARSAKAGSTLEWLDFLPLEHERHTYASRKLVLGILAYYFAAAGPGIGYVDGFGDWLWRKAMQEGRKPEDVFGFYMDKKLGIDSFKTVWKRAGEKGLKFTLDGRPLAADFNHHDAMAAFLACHYREAGEELLSQAVPMAIGYAYEGLDFISHIRTKEPLKNNIREFQRDTLRYQTSTKIGFDFCR